MRTGVYTNTKPERSGNCVSQNRGRNMNDFEIAKARLERGFRGVWTKK